MKTQLLSRDAFREAVFARDQHRCVVCQRTVDDRIKLDAHHIMERRLWQDADDFGGYFLNNGATLCDTDGKVVDFRHSCHMQAGMTVLTPQKIREAAKIERVALPSHLYRDQEYTVWGDPVLPNGSRMKGELFWEENVQKMLKLGEVLHLYTDCVRHPRTYHLHFSPKILSGDVGDDKVMENDLSFEGQDVIVTPKYDGCQCTMYRDRLHARTLNFKSDVTWHWIQNFHKKFSYDIPEGYRLNVENLWGSATAGIQYHNLQLYLMAWMMWDDKNNCLSWEDTLEWFSLFSETLKASGVSEGLPAVPVLYDGIYDQKAIAKLWTPMYNGDPMEGFVVRLKRQFHYRDFKDCVGKYVSAIHKPRFDSILVKNELANTGKAR